MKRKKETKNNEIKYQLTDNSKSAGNDFGYANSSSSKIYEALKNVFKNTPDSKCYRRLLKTVRAIVNSDHTNPVGAKVIGSGDVALLNGFRLNERRFFESMLGWSPAVTIDIAQNRIEILIPPDTGLEFPNWPDRASQTECRFYALLFGKEHRMLAASGTEGLFLKKNEKRKMIKANLMFDHLEDGLLLIFGYAQYHLYLKNTTNQSDFASNNRLHFAADILKAVYIQGGQVVTYTPNEPMHQTPVVVNELKLAKWESVE